MIGRRLALRDVPQVSASVLRHAAALLTRSYQRTVGVLAVIRDGDGRVLLVRTGYPPRLWNLPGGRLERGETPGGGLSREVREETGLDVEVGDLLLVHVRAAAVSFVFDCRIIGGRPEPGAGEIRALRWAGPDEIERLSAPVRLTLRAALGAIGDHPRHLF